jgi:hypothetical protein
MKYFMPLSEKASLLCKMHSAFAHTCLLCEYHTPRNAVPVPRTVKLNAFPHSRHVQKRNVGGMGRQNDLTHHSFYGSEAYRSEIEVHLLTPVTI